MTDNVYYVEDLVRGGNTVTLTDDGTGIDWLVLRNSHDGAAISLCWWSVRGLSTEAESIYVDNDIASELIVLGRIENARGAMGEDWIRGNEADNVLFGDALAEGPGGMDTLDGAEGNDTIQGGAGDDEIIGGTGNDQLFGNADDDTIQGGSGRDTIQGGTGADSLNGGGNAGDLLSYAQSSAGVQVSLTFGALTACKGGDAEGDRVTGFFDLLGSAHDDRLGDAIATTLTEGRNANLFDGGLGNDLLSMGGGNDTGLGGGGNDTVLGGAGDDSLDGGIGRDMILGEAGNDTVIGGLGSDMLNGGDGADRLIGGDGTDTLLGDAGNDVLISGRGADQLTGGQGADVFVFANVFDSGTGAGFDTITDFKRTEGDRIDLSDIDANRHAAGDAAFTFLGTGAFTGAGAELRVISLSTGWRVMADLDGDRTADFILFLSGTDMAAPVAADFVL
ncbi:calcium-binding protein [Rhodobacter capsulatus]|uniref:Calcium-binding protein n=1 Tax=Rhodobacter capsulatus TaxID=1061 RepID=A0A4U1JRZ8_RHOCA|nr:calcium-binding protein [Rhodobacter capsulatus]TKD21814.1 calcium-binding protein [Rhodobacter capsulatus]